MVMIEGPGPDRSGPLILRLVTVTGTIACLEKFAYPGPGPKPGPTVGTHDTRL